MIDALRTFLENLATNLRLADFIDIALVAVFLFVLIAWMRRSTSRGTARRLAVLLALFTAVYVSALTFDMYLVGRVAEVFFIVFILVMIVVFQSDLRRMLDRTGAWLFSGASKGTALSPVDQLTEAVAYMAREQTGALIAIRGNEPWDRHIQGGIKLGGDLSPPLLYGIFDHRTPGHDGALLIEGDSIVSFAAHLPLSDNVPEISKYGGTRHAAGLGLAERTDAFVIVVSEERGTISVAQNGAIVEVESSRELKERLEQFWSRTYDKEAGAPRAWKGKHGFVTAAVSLILAATLWLLFAYSPGTIFRTYEVPIEYRDVPPEWILQDGDQWADITISGPEQAFRLIDAERLTIALDMEEPEEGWNEFAIDRDNLDLPEQLSLESVEPDIIRIRARHMTSVRLPVSVPTEGTLSDALRLVDVQAEPDSATVLVPEESPRFSEVYTESVDLSEVSQDTTFQRTLVLVTDMRFPPDADVEVEVHVEVDRVDADDDS